MYKNIETCCLKKPPWRINETRHQNKEGLNASILQYLRMWAPSTACQEPRTITTALHKGHEE